MCVRLYYLNIKPKYINNKIIITTVLCKYCIFLEQPSLLSYALWTSNSSLYPSSSPSVIGYYRYSLLHHATPSDVTLLFCLAANYLMSSLHLFWGRATSPWPYNTKKVPVVHFQRPSFVISLNNMTRQCPFQFCFILRLLLIPKKIPSWSVNSFCR